MAKYEDLTGKKFGRLTALEPTEEKTKDGRRIWKCICDCGNIKFTSCQNLKRGHCTSCGCKNKEQITQLGKNNGIDITGERFGKLIAIERASKKLPYSDSVAWICQCDCGNQVIKTVSELRSGNTMSCGCFKKSHGEREIAILLINNNIKFETQKTFNDLKSMKNHLLKFDFYLNDLNILIEFDGTQHYEQTNFTTETTIQNDILKNRWCLENNITLYRIPYYELKNISKWKIEDLLNDNFIVKKEDHYNMSN